MTMTSNPEVDYATGHPPNKASRSEELIRAREMIDSLSARSAEGGHEPITQVDLKEFTQTLSTVVDLLQRLEETGTVTTVPETVETTATDDSLHSLAAARVDDSYQEAVADDECHSLGNEPRRTHSPRRRTHKHKHNQVYQRHDSTDSDVLDETDFSQALSGYEDGFYPEEDAVSDTFTSFNDTFAGSAVSELGFGSPNTRRSKASASVKSEESQCFYCALHGNGEGCSGTRFCC